MARKKRVVKQGPEASLVTGLFGNVTELGDEELQLIYKAIAPGEDAAAVVESLTSEAAERYANRNKPCPGHVRAAATISAATRVKTAGEGESSEKM